MVMGDHGESLGDHGEKSSRLLHLQQHHARAVRRPRAVQPDRVTAGSPIRSVPSTSCRRRSICSACPPGRHRRREPHAADDRQPPPNWASTPIRRPCIRCITTAGATSGRCDRAATRSSTRRARSSTTRSAIRRRRPTLYQERRALGDRMIEQAAQAWNTARQRPPSTQAAAPVDPEARQRLAALGYVGSFVATAADSRTGRADPKDKIGLFNQARRSHRADQRDRSRRRAALRPHLRPPQRYRPAGSRGDRRVVHARHAVDGPRQARRLGGVLQATLELKPDYDLAVYNLAQAYRRVGNDDAAMAGFEHYLTLDPKDPYVHYQMGEIWLDRGDTAKAEELFRRALEIDPQVAAAKNALGVIALKRGDPAAAERLIREALASKPDLRRAHFNLALRRGTARRHPDGGTRILRGAAGTPRRLQGGVQHVAAVRAGRGPRGRDRRPQAVDREQSRSLPRATSSWPGAISTPAAISTRRSRSRAKASSSRPTPRSRRSATTSSPISTTGWAVPARALMKRRSAKPPKRASSQARR